MVFHENRLPADDSHEISCLICYFRKRSKFLNCRLLQIIDGALRVNPYPTNIYFVLKMLSSTNIQMHFRPDFIMEANSMSPEQTAP